MRLRCENCGFYLSDSWKHEVMQKPGAKMMGKHAIANTLVDEHWLTCPACGKRYFWGEDSAPQIVSIEIET